MGHQPHSGTQLVCDWHWCVLPTAYDPILLPNGSAQGVLGLNRVRSYTSPDEYRYNLVVDSLDNFSFFLGTPTKDHPNASSWLLLNGVNEPLIQQRQRIPVLLPFDAGNDPGWSVSIQRMHFGEQAFSKPCDKEDSACIMHFDPQEHFLVLPFADGSDKDGSLLRAMFPVECVCQYDKWFECPRNVTLPTISFTLRSTASTGWTTFDIHPSEYAQEMEGSDLVAVHVRYGSHGFVLGERFLRKYYSYYQVHRGVTLYCPPQSCNEIARVPWSSAQWYETRWFWGVLVAVVWGAVLVRVGVWWNWWRNQQRQMKTRRRNFHAEFDVRFSPGQHPKPLSKVSS